MDPHPNQTDFPHHDPETSRPGTTLSKGEGLLEPEAARELARTIGTSLIADKCEDVVILDVSRLSPVTGYIVIGSGTSARQMRSALEHLRETAGEMGASAYDISEDESAVWLLADFVDVVVHLFEPNTRAHYDLEMLWGDAPRVDVPEPTLPGGADGGGAGGGGA